MLVIPAWIVFAVTHILCVSAGALGVFLWQKSRPVHYMKVTAELDQDGNPVLAAPIYWNDESVALRESFGPGPSNPIPGLDDGR